MLLVLATIIFSELWNLLTVDIIRKSDTVCFAEEIKEMKATKLKIISRGRAVIKMASLCVQIQLPYTTL
jgi:hypothetical protein